MTNNEITHLYECTATKVILKISTITFQNFFPLMLSNHD